MLAVFLFVPLFLISVSSSFAHPGRTASDGCHYCRTNCDKWGEVWNARHCHGAPAVINIPITKPTSTPIPTATPKPTSTPTFSPTATYTPTSEPTQSRDGKVKGEDISPTDIPDQEGYGIQTADIVGLILLGAIGGVGGYWLFRKLNKTNED